MVAKSANPSANELREGETFADLTFTIAPTTNEQYIFAQGDYAPRYLPSPWGQGQAHPGLLMQMLAPTRSPSYWIPSGMGAVLGSATTSFFGKAWVNRTYTISWVVSKIYEKRGKDYHVIVAQLKDDAGTVLVERISNVVYLTA